MLNVAVVGTGSISAAHLADYLMFPDRCRVVALCDAVPSGRTPSGSSSGCPTPTS